MLKLGEIIQNSGENVLRTSQPQDFVIRWIKAEELPILFQRLKEVDLADTGRKNINQIVCCKGALTCKLGICFSTALAKAIGDKLDNQQIYLSDMPELSLKISGCPNCCGHHPIGTIGLSGAARHIQGKPMPYYEVYLGGKVEEGKTALGKEYGLVPAKAVPQILAELLSIYKNEERNYDQDFYKFILKENERMNELITKHAELPKKLDGYYFDWGSETEFSLAGRGVGECGAGVFEVIESDIREADKFFKEEQFFHALISICRSLLIIRGSDPKSDQEVLDVFAKDFIDTGWAKQSYTKLIEQGRNISDNRSKDIKIDKESLGQLIERIKALFDSLDSNLEFQIDKEEEKNKSMENKIDINIQLDLRGVKCPLNYVKTKLEIEKMNEGEIIQVLLDEGEPIANVPASLKEDGQEVMNIEKINSHYKVIVKKQA